MYFKFYILNIPYDSLLASRPRKSCYSSKENCAEYIGPLRGHIAAFRLIGDIEIADSYDSTPEASRKHGVYYL
ncbi:hypothetical protein TMatcc_002875 [Talaromyces marneffei ATCC 18224]